MTLVQVLASALSGLGVLVWLVNLALLAKCVWSVPRLSRLSAPEPATWPKVSVVIPACNEAHTLEASTRAHLQSDYPDFELVLVDDRSVDGTAELVDRLAALDARVRAAHVTELPPGWLGKVHALSVGQGLATGEWLLFTDADAHVRPDTLRRMVSWCEAEAVDLVSPVVRLTAPRALLDVVVGAFARLVFIASQPWRSADPGAKQAFGLGAFILVRRVALERSEGFSWLRLEVADDMGLALAVKRAGGSLRVVNASDFIELQLYTTAEEMRRSTEKGGYSIIGRYSAARTIVLSSLVPVLELSPFAGFLPVNVPWLPAVGALGVVMMLASTLASTKWMGRPLWTGLAYPLGILWLSWLQVRSAIICGRQGGVRWRDTFYPQATLRAGVRVNWP